MSYQISPNAALLSGKRNLTPVFQGFPLKSICFFNRSGLFVFSYCFVHHIKKKYWCILTMFMSSATSTPEWMQYLIPPLMNRHL